MPSAGLLPFLHIYDNSNDTEISVSMPSTGLLPFLLWDYEEDVREEVVSMPSTSLLPFLRWVCDFWRLIIRKCVNALNGLTSISTKQMASQKGYAECVNALNGLTSISTRKTSASTLQK